MIIHTIRTASVLPGGRCYVLFPKGEGGWSAPSLPSGWSFFWPAKYSVGSDWHRQWVWGIRVAADAEPGDYYVQTPGNEVITITVAEPPEARPWGQATSISGAETLLAMGFDVTLAPGLYEVDAPISIPDGATIRSAGAVLRRKLGSDYANRMFVPEGGMTLDGLVLEHEGYYTDEVVYVHNYPYEPGDITIRNCVIRRGELLRDGPAGVVVENCRFEKSSSGQIPSSSFWFDNDFVGNAGYGRHALFNTGSVGSLLCSNRFDGTARGIVFQSGDCRGNVVMDTTMRNIRGGQQNANECIMMEAGTNGEIEPGENSGMRDNAFIDVFINDCATTGIMLYGSGMHDNIFWSVDAMTDVISVFIAALNTGTIGPNLFRDFQATGALKLNGFVGGQELINFQWLEQVQGRGNAGHYASVLGPVNENFPIDADTAAAECEYEFSGCGMVDKDRIYNLVSSV